MKMVVDSESLFLTPVFYSVARGIIPNGRRVPAKGRAERRVGQRKNSCPWSPQVVLPRGLTCLGQCRA